MYQVLARKYRPRNFIELVGQNHVSRALTSALERGRLHHAYLFTGTRGVGKTTIARILAKCLNCETGITSTPCEVCATCTAVNEGRFIDLIEIDAASRTKVEDTRELLDNVPYAPTQGRFKVYLIDEVHMLSTHSFNALLKTLEEPPEHVKFLFATTDPQKLPITVISRCLQFTLRPLAVDEITTHLTDILNKENISAEADAIWQIAESAQGSLRDALSLTDQAIAYGQGAIQHRDVKEMLGLIDRTIIYDLILAIHQNQPQRVSELLMQFRQQALDVSLVLDQFISTLHELALLQYLPDLSLKYSAEINKKIMQLSGLISAQDLQLYYQVACKGRADLHMAVTQEQGFEMCVLRLLAFRPIRANEVVVRQEVATLAAEQAPQHSDSLAIQTVQIQQEQLTHAVDNVELSEGLQSSTQSNVQSDATNNNDSPNRVAVENNNFQGNYDPELDEFDEYATSDADASSQKLAHEPSSDDYLDDEDDVLNVNDAEQHASSVFSDQTNPTESDIVKTNVVETNLVSIQSEQVEDHKEFSLSAEPVENSATLDAEDASLITQKYPEVEGLSSSETLQSTHLAPELSTFGGPLSTMHVQPTTQQSDIFFLNPEDTEKQQEAVVSPSTPVSAEQAAHNDSMIAQSKVNTIQTSVLKDQQSPQDILKLVPQDLTGEWTLDKWEFWFRNSDLSPAVQELAQQGIMTGQIDGVSIFHIPSRYEQLLSQLQHVLDSTLKNQWAGTQFSIQYQEVETITPYVLQAERKQRAYQRAADLLHEEPIVKSLMDALDGKIHNIQLKP